MNRRAALALVWLASVVGALLLAFSGAVIPAIVVGWCGGVDTTLLAISSVTARRFVLRAAADDPEA